MNKKSITMEQLADELGLSRVTVSKALRGLPGMSLTTRQAVLALAEKKGYLTKERKESDLFEHTSLMSLAPRRFLVIFPDGEPSLHSVHMELMKGINERYQGSSHQVTPVFVQAASLKGPAAFGQWAEQSGIAYADGIFIPPMLPPELEAWLLALPLHRIMLNFPPAGVPCDSVVWDVHDLVRQAVRLLAGKGHRRILYIGDNESARGFRLRWSAFLESMAEYGLPVDPADHLLSSFHATGDWQQQFQQLLADKQPTAILNTIEHNLSWVYYLCNQAGLSIPEDCSVVSLDISASTAAPGLSYFYMPVRETGYRAADRMIWRIANPGLPYEHIRLQGRYVDEGSVRSISTT